VCAVAVVGATYNSVSKTSLHFAGVGHSPGRALLHAAQTLGLACHPRFDLASLTRGDSRLSTLEGTFSRGSSNAPLHSKKTAVMDVSDRLVARRAHLAPFCRVENVKQHLRLQSYYQLARQLYRQSEIYFAEKAWDNASVTRRRGSNF
jgi:hypothetical protein